MADVTICSLKALSHTVRAYEPTTVVSAIPVTFDGEQAFQHVSVPIEDIYNVQLRAYKDAIRKVLACESERIVVHCEHGQSRSAALAIAKVYQQNPDDVATFLDQHPEAEPNPLLLLLADELLGADGDLLKRCRERYKGRRL